MKVAAGIKVADGIAIGKIRIHHAPSYDIDGSLVEDAAAELARFDQARGRVRDQQHALYERALQSAGEDSAAIFEAHELMLDDEDLLDVFCSVAQGIDGERP